MIKLIDKRHVMFGIAWASVWKGFAPELDSLANIY